MSTTIHLLLRELTEFFPHAFILGDSECQIQ